MSSVTKPIMLNETGEQIVQALAEVAESNKSYELLLNTKADKVDVSAPFNFKGTTTYAKLPTSGNTINDTYYCEDKLCRYTWNGEGWYQSSMNEVDYTDELAQMAKDITDIDSKLSSEIGYNTAEIETFLHEAIAIEKLDSTRILRKTLRGFTNGEATSNSKFDTTVLIPTKSRYLRLSKVATVHCYDENENWLRVTAPLKQGNKMRVYLGDDVRYIALVYNKGDLPYDYYSFIWTDYIFDFVGEKVDYYYVPGSTGEGAKNTNGKSIEYVFEYYFLSIPIYGIPAIIVGCNGSQRTITKGAKEVVYSSSNVGSAIVNVTIPYYTTDTDTEYKAQIGKELPTLNVCCYGTSITDIRSTGKYPIQLRNLMNGDETNFTIRGIGGGKFVGNIKENILSYSDSFDLVILEGCANDWYFGETIEEMRVAIREIMEHLNGKADKIVFVTDHTSRSYGSMVGGASHVVNGLTSREYYLKCAEIFASYGAITIDAGMLSGINEFKSEMYVDQIHHSDLGGYTFAKAVYNELIRLGLFKND